MRICVVDEDNLAVSIFKDFLEKLGFEVEGFESPSALLEMSSDNRGRVDVILMDPGPVKGRVEDIVGKAHASCPGAYIVLMSYEDVTLPFESAISNRIFGYLRKPVRLTELELILTRAQESLSRQVAGSTIGDKESMSKRRKGG
jgi:DNA-binding NtrC family response regulator